MHFIRFVRIPDEVLFVVVCLTSVGQLEVVLVYGPSPTAIDGETGR